MVMWELVSERERKKDKKKSNFRKNYHAYQQTMTMSDDGDERQEEKKN